MPTPPDWGDMEEPCSRWRVERDLRAQPGAPRGRRPVRLLRGPAHGQRPARLAPRPVADVQGHLPPVPDHARAVRRAQGGWDCHGLPVELEVEKRTRHLGQAGDRGLRHREPSTRCAESRFWATSTSGSGSPSESASGSTRSRAYRTMDPDYIESVWWSLEDAVGSRHDLRGDKVVPYCPRCGTALSSHEVALGYRDVDDPSVYVRFPLDGADGTSLLVWTTTPWTLPSNQAAAVHPDVTYAEVRVGDERLVVAEPLVARVFGDGAAPERTFPGAELVGRRLRAAVPIRRGRPSRRRGALRDHRRRHRHRPHRAGLR